MSGYIMVPSVPDQSTDFSLYWSLFDVLSIRELFGVGRFRARGGGFGGVPGAPDPYKNIYGIAAQTSAPLASAGGVGATGLRINPAPSGSARPASVGAAASSQG